MLPEFFTDAIAELSRELAITAPDADTEGVVTFAFTSDLDLRCFVRGNAIMLEGTVTDMSVRPLPKAEANALYQRLLHTSLGIMKDSAVTLCLSQDNKQILLHRRFISGTHSRARFADVAEEFLNRLELLRAKATAPQRTSVPPTQAMFMRP